MAAKAFPYQQAGVKAIEEFGGRCLLADEMGLGKTLQALWFLKRERLQTLPALVVCPASVKYTWEAQAREHVGVRAQVLEGQTPPTGRVSDVVPELTIINPDILRHWLPYLKKLGIRTIVLDECQMFQNPRAKRTKAAMQLARQTPHVLAMSGTPLTNRPSELWPTLHMVRPDLFPSFFSYAQTYCEPKRTPWGWEYKGATNLAELHGVLRGSCMVRRLKADVLGELPAKVRHVVPMELSKPDEYNEARDDFMGWLRKNHYGNRATRAARAAAVTRIGYLLRLSAQLKARSVVQWAQRWLEESDGKLVVFAIHQKMIGVLQRRLGVPTVTVDGSVTGRKRKYAVDQFRRDPNCRVFIGNIKAAGTGVDGLQDVADTMAFAELWWRPGDHIQAEDRIHRIGQNRVAWINYLVAGGTIEEDLCRIIQTKQQTIRATLDGGPLNEDLDVFDQLLNVMEKPHDNK